MKAKTLKKVQNAEEVKLRKRLKKLFTKEELKATAAPSNRATVQAGHHVCQEKPCKTTIPKVKKSNAVQSNQTPVGSKQSPSKNIAKKQNTNQKKPFLNQQQQKSPVPSEKLGKVPDTKPTKKPKTQNNIKAFSQVKASNSNKHKDTLPTKKLKKSQKPNKPAAKNLIKQNSKEQTLEAQHKMNGDGPLKPKKRRVEAPIVSRSKKPKRETLVVSKRQKDAETVSLPHRRQQHYMHDDRSMDSTDCSDSNDVVDYYNDSGDFSYVDDDHDYSSDNDDISYADDHDDSNYSYVDDDQDDSDYEYVGSSEQESFSDYGDDIEYIEPDSNPYNFDDISDDEDYHLPRHVLEDLIIHKGTAEKRALTAEDNVEFDNDDEEAQIVELPNDNVKTILQAEAYHFEELRKLNEKPLGCRIFRKQHDESNLNCDAISDTADCPPLVPIVDQDGFQLYVSESDSYCSMESYSSVASSEVSSFIEEDINSKYLSGAEFSNDEEEQVQMKAVVINAENCDYHSISAESDANQEEPMEQLPFERLTELNTITNMDAELVTATVMETENSLDMTIDSQVVSAESSINLGNKSSTKAFRSIFCNAVDSNHVLVLLKDSIYLYGTMCMTLVAGAVELYGYSPVIGDEFEIFSPRGCSSVSIAAAPNKTSSRQLEDELLHFESYFSRKDLQHIAAEFEVEHDAVILLRSNAERKKLINFFKKYMNENVFPNMNSINKKRPLYASECLLKCVINFASEKALYVPTEWSALQFNNQSKVMIVGGKAVGKSTLLRYLVNRHLTTFKRVLLIDLDIGQGEIFVPQTISCTVVAQPLLGPGFFLNKQPDRAYMLGHSNIVLCAHQYLRTVKQLLSYCHSHEEFSQMPWFVNTMGYNKGFGMELIGMIAQLLRPTDLVQLQSNKDVNNFDAILAAHVLATTPRNVYIGEEFVALQENVAELQYRLHVLNTAIPQASRYQRDWDMSGKDFRYAIFLSRLSEALQGNAEMLTDCMPFCTSLKDLKIVNMHSSENETTEEEVIQAVEVNLVFLCQRENQHESTEALQCYGIGVVRAIDYHLQQLYLLPAMPYSRLKRVDCLALGEMPLPTSLFTNQGSKVRSEAPFVHNTIDAKSSKSIKQIHHRPARFLKGKHRDVLKD